MTLTCQEPDVHIPVVAAAMANQDAWLCIQMNPHWWALIKLFHNSLLGYFQLNVFPVKVNIFLSCMCSEY